MEPISLIVLGGLAILALNALKGGAVLTKEEESLIAQQIATGNPIIMLDGAELMEKKGLKDKGLSYYRYIFNQAQNSSDNSAKLAISTRLAKSQLASAIFPPGKNLATDIYKYLGGT